LDASLLLSAALGLAGGLAAAGSLLWKLSGQLTKLEEQLRTQKEHQEKQDEACKAQFKQLNDDFDRYTREQDDKWQELNRTLGQIEGELRSPNQRKLR